MGERLKVHCLSNGSHNDFIAECSKFLKQRFGRNVVCKVLCNNSKSNQHSFYVTWFDMNQDLKLWNNFLKSVDSCNKTESEISQTMTKVLESHGFPVTDCCGQGYENAANRSGKYKEA